MKDTYLKTKIKDIPTLLEVLNTVLAHVKSGTSRGAESLFLTD